MKKNIIKSIVAASFVIGAIVSFNVDANARIIEDTPTVRCACSVFGHTCKARRHGAYCGEAPCSDHSDTNC